MTVYLLDTNTVSYLADRTSAFHEPAKRRLASVPEESEVAISILTLYELTYGFAYHPASSRLLSIVQEGQVRIVQLTEAGAKAFAALKHAYRRHTGGREKAVGRHNVDLILADSAMVEGAVLVSNDALFRTLAELEPRLAIENWAAA